MYLHQIWHPPLSSPEQRSTFRLARKSNHKSFFASNTTCQLLKFHRETLKMHISNSTTMFKACYQNMAQLLGPHLSKLLQGFVKVILWIRGERILFFGPNTNTNIIRNQNFDQIRIRIIFVFSEWANTNTNNIRAQIFGRIRIRIIFGFRIVPKYEYE